MDWLRRLFSADRIRRVMYDIFGDTRNDKIVAVLTWGSVALIYRRNRESMDYIADLKAEKKSIIETSDSIRNTLWNWHKLILADSEAAAAAASASDGGAALPFITSDRLKTIYEGRGVPPPIDPKKSQKSQKIKFMI